MAKFKCRTNLIGRQSLENLNSPVKVVYHFLLREIILIAMRFEGADTGAVLVPFMLPQVLIIEMKVFPVLAHIFEQVSTASVN